MLIPIDVPTGLTERTQIVSGGIHRASFPNVGVIYTTSDNASADDFETDFLMNCKVLGPTGVEFTIIGGYFFERKQSGPGVAVSTTNVFGVALDPSRGFDITEGGSKTIAESRWDHIDPDFAGFNLNERAPQAEPKGWTLIVAEALSDREEYPPSGKLIKMMGECANNISAIEMEEVEETNENKTIQFSVVLEGGTASPMAFRWDFGDGMEMVTSTRTAMHTYQKEPAAQLCDVKVESIVQSSCSTSSIVLTGVEIGPCPCAELIKIETNVLEEHETELEIEFTALVRDADASQYNWDFGDGSSPAQGKTVVHKYTRSAQDEGRVFRIIVTTAGPEHCSSQSVMKMVPWAPSGA